MKKHILYTLLLLLCFAFPTLALQFKRGLDANLPSSAKHGEPLVTTDTKRFFVGFSTSLKEYLAAARFVSFSSHQTTAHAGLSAHLLLTTTAHGGITPPATFTNISSAIMAHALLTATAHGGIPPKATFSNISSLLMAHRSLTTTAHGGITPPATFTNISSAIMAHALLTTTAHGGIVAPSTFTNISTLVKRYQPTASRSNPSGAPAYVGLIFVNTSTAHAWISVGTSSVANWKQMDN